MSSPRDAPISSLGHMWWAANNPPADPKSSFAGKTILITGANVGLGFEACLKFAALGASRLILGARSLKRGEAAKVEVCKQTGYRSQDIVIYALGMGTFSGVNAFVAEVDKHEPRIDIAILHAGIAAHHFELGPEGYESSVLVNGLSTALLAALLLPKLRSSSKLSGSPSRLQITGSCGHHLAPASKLDFPASANILDEVSKPEYFNMMDQYCLTKLLNMYTQDALVEAQARHGGADEVIITVVCPGLCRTNLGRDFPYWQRVCNGVFQKIFARSAEQGSRTMVSGVALGKDAHGEFWSHDVFYRKGELCKGQEGKRLQKRVWGEMLEVLQRKAGFDPSQL
ncbi:uncharacterized protein HMPREF1541_09775 [Cyphellophora europaea CBS 101466]|uniref:Ketoreductase (KR) domain-containing protein n=1 Tax=Cyphellophora europaea (strain CBS 101466) TaxID=1220924 RepID=W2S8F5_CYPE1|nr:uncharacterized protein HMPREF1541_09775 [Cyphellophora europaea CBS 101466]ETN44900.1 hypothetical protein HMPREF1541_09775 [Cyphellophora europaea CBS 101466]